MRLTSRDCYPSWETQNVDMWINHDQNLYEFTYRLLSKLGLYRASKELDKNLQGTLTPDGARFTYQAILYTLSNMEV